MRIGGRRFFRAIADYDQAIELDSKYAAAYYNRGLAYRHKGLNSEAEADFEVYQKLIQPQ